MERLKCAHMFLKFKNWSLAFSQFSFKHHYSDQKREICVNEFKLISSFGMFSKYKLNWKTCQQSDSQSEQLITIPKFTLHQRLSKCTCGNFWKAKKFAVAFSRIVLTAITNLKAKETIFFFFLKKAFQFSLWCWRLFKGLSTLTHIHAYKLSACY